MPQGPDGKTIIIVKKVSGHGGHHGGSWKVAYADFVTSMMAFFMVLWLVNTASVQTRERIASYFRKPGVFVKGSGTPIELGGAGILPDTFAPPAEANSQIQPSKRIYNVESEEGTKREAFGSGEGKGDAKEDQTEVQIDKGKGAGTGEMNKVAEQLKSLVARDKNTIGGLLGQVSVSVDQRGLHLEIMDTPTASMFERGSATVLGGAEEELLRIAKLLGQLPNPVDIEGHTDAVPFSSKLSTHYDNWNLSTDRANTARRLLVQAGVKESQIARVVGYAAQRPKVQNDPLHPSNRRISISMRYTEQAAVILRGTRAIETRSVPLRIPEESSEATQAAQPTPQPGNHLDVEVSTSTPEGTPISPPGLADEELAKPSFMDQEKIFDDRNSFFGIGR